jgi:hypothetical protein
MKNSATTQWIEGNCKFAKPRQKGAPPASPSIAPQNSQVSPQQNQLNQQALGLLSNLQKLKDKGTLMMVNLQNSGIADVLRQALELVSMN